MEIIGMPQALEVFTLNDFEELENQLYIKSGQLYCNKAWNRTNFSQYLPRKDDFSFCAMENNCLLAFAIGYEYSPGWAHISKVGVNPTLQGKGIGKALVSEQTAVIFLNKINLITIETRIENKTAVNLYKDLGYTTLNKDQVKKYISIRGREKNQYLGKEKIQLVLKKCK